VVGAVVTVEAPVAVSFAGAICARQRHVVEMRVDAVKMVAQWRRWRLPVTGYAPSQIRIREYRWGVAAEGEPRA
jgi:hypothetical protein